MLKEQLKKYEDLQIIDIMQLQTNAYVRYGQLVVDVSNFSHPGTNRIIQPFFNADIELAFQAKNHSMNAKIMIVHLTIGKISNQKGKGYRLFKEVQEYQFSILHEQVMGKLDFQSPLLPQLAKLDEKEKQAFITIPKFTNNQKLRFNEGKWSQFYYLDNFWYSHCVFQIVGWAIITYLYTNSFLFNDMYSVVLVVFGIFKWTLIEYYFHRFDLHSAFQPGQTINGHYIHHAFPRFRYKLALSFHRTIIDQMIFFAVYYYLIGLSVSACLHIILGTHLSLTLYDTLHYYFHFGPELNIPILRQLKKNHLKHHFRNPNKGFGVTNTFWDRVFGTHHQK